MSVEELSQLVNLHKKTKNRRDADKIKCIIYWGSGWTWEEIKEALFITDGTIKSYIDAYKNDGISEFLKNRHDGHNYKLNSEQETKLVNYVDTYNVLSSKQACSYLKNKFGKLFSDNGMTQTLKRLGFTYKKPKAVPCKANTFSQINFLVKYYQKMLTLKDDEAIYFVDASGFEHNAKMAYGWIRKGSNKEVKTNSGRQRLNVNGAYNPISHEVIAVSQDSNINADSNIALVERILEFNRDKRRITLIFDNAKMNRSRKLKEFFENQEISIEPMYLPTYSPNLNLIERLWRFAKKKLLSNKYYSSFIKFKAVLDDFFEIDIWKMKKELKLLMNDKFQIFGL
ncbi:MAG: IS630 family transposase [Spirochaetota bacterium]|nr:IS630 family transposase [Spirochaetota bacterium]